MGDEGDVVVASAGHECVCGSRGLGIVSCAADMLGVSVVRGMRGVGGVCEMYMYLALGGEGREWIRGLGLGFTNPVERGEVLDVCLCLDCGGVGVQWVGGGVCARVWKGGMVWSYVCVSCVYGRSMYLYIVLGGYLHILGAPSVHSVSTLSISASYHVFVCGRYRKSRFVCVWLSDLDLPRDPPFYGKQCQPSSGSA